MAHFVLSPKQAQQFKKTSSGLLQTHFKLNAETLTRLKTGSMDILPYDISLPYAYHLNWQPRPTLQSYAAYNAMLDQLNAQHFYQTDRPQHLLYAFKSIDGRYPLFDEPAVFKAIWQNYTPINLDHDFLLLSSKTNSQIVQKTVIQKSLVDFNSPFFIPQDKTNPLWVKLTIQPTLFGRLFSWIYKEPILRVKLGLSDNREKNFRFIPATASNGLFVSRYANDIHGVQKILEGKFSDAQRIQYLTISFPNQRFYKQWCFKNKSK
jgi:hypothetical protein